MNILFLLYKSRFSVLFCTLIVGAFLFPSVRKAVQTDNSLKVWFLQGDPNLVNYQKFQERFGNDEVLIFMVHDAKGLVNQERLVQFKKLTQALESLPEVQSVAGAGRITIYKRELLGYYPEELTESHSTPEEFKAKLDAFSIIKAQLFTPDYRTARFVVTLKKLPDFNDRRGEIIDNIKTVIYKYTAPEQTFFGGIGIIYTGLNRLSQADFGFFLSVGYLLMFVVMLLVYRNLLVLVYALGTVALATFITLGLYGLCGFRLNLMTTLLPIIFMLLGIMDITHILNEVSALTGRTESSRKEVALESLRRMWQPGLFNSLTAMVGFLSLLTSPMAILQSFGVFSAIGIGLCFVFTYTLGVIILPMIRISPNISGNSNQHLRHLFRHVLANQWNYSVLSCSIVLFSLLGIYFLKSDTYTLGYFPTHDKVVQDHRQMEKLWGAYLPLDFLIETGKTPLYSPEIVKSCLAFGDSARKMKDIGNVFGFYSIYLAGLQQYKPTKYKQLMKSKSALLTAHAKAHTFYLKLSQQYIHEASQTGRITLFGEMASAVALTQKIDTIRRYAQNTIGQNARFSPTGYQPMYSGIVQYVTQSQVYSLLSASVFIFLLIWAFIQDIKLALLAVIANFFPIITMLGIMGWLGICLDTATASIAAIVLSICIDDTVHYIYHYQWLKKRGDNAAEALEKTASHIGSAVVITGLFLFCGYALMMFGSLQTVQLFGLLTAIAIITGIFGELVIFPIMLKVLDDK